MSSDTDTTPCCITYRSGYKYQLREPYRVTVGIKPRTAVGVDDFVSLDPDGTLSIKRGYAWDGPSGPTIDTQNFMRGSLVHDALYQLIRNGLLQMVPHRKMADRELERICAEDGMLWPRRRWVYAAVRLFAEDAATEASKKPESTAPRNCRDCQSDEG